MKFSECGLQAQLEAALFDSLIERESTVEKIALRCVEQGYGSLSLGQQLAYSFFIHPLLCRYAKPVEAEKNQGWATPATRGQAGPVQVPGAMV